MSKTVISIESTADITKELIERYSFAMINMEYCVDDVTYVMGDGTLSAGDFYQMMRQGAVTKTTLINEYDATEHLRAILGAGNDVIHLAFSSSLSGTCESFIKAKQTLEKEYPERKIAVIDSLCACSGQGLFAVIVAEYLACHTFEETVSYANELRHRMVHLFVVDDLKYLARGGRISKATAIFGNTIHMKPVMHMNKSGALVAYKKVISRKKSLMEITNLTAEKHTDECGRIFIAHADCADDAAFVAERILRDTGITPEIMDLGMVIGCHSGPGTLAVFFTGNERE